jgi:hypothetical protein
MASSPAAREWDDGARASGAVEREERQVSLYRVGALTVAGRRELCVVRNVSTGGMMLHAYSTIEPDAAISIEFKHGSQIHGRVKWVEGHSVGVQFDEPIDVEAVLASAPEGLRPRMPRIGIATPVTVREEGVSREMRAIDISQGGVCVEGSEALTLGADVVVSIGGLPAERAVVRWRNGDCYGIGFNRLLSVNCLSDWLQQYREAGAAEV